MFFFISANPKFESELFFVLLFANGSPKNAIGEITLFFSGSLIESDI